MEKKKTSKIKENIDKAKNKIVSRIKKIEDENTNNIYDYVSYYGKYSFSYKKFNEIDNLIFSFLAYINLEGIVSSNERNKLTLNEIKKIYFEKYTKKDIDKLMFTTREAVKLLDLLGDSHRYKDINVYNYLYVGDENSQFSAATFEINKKLCYVAFEGTDMLISGWEEDCKMAYNFPVTAQILAKKYLDRFTLKNVKLIVGGHSKGGNLALVSSMYSNYFVKKKIINIYSNDGQGLRKAQIESKYYEKIKDRYIHIIPNSSIVGLLLRHENNYIVVKSNMPGLLSHDMLTWQVSFDHLEKARLSRFSKVFDDGFLSWLDKYDDEKRKLFVKSVFDILRENNIETLLQFKENYKELIKVIKSSKNINPMVKEMTLDLVKVIAKTNLEYPLL